MTSLTQNVHMVGIELEGGWSREEHMCCTHDCEEDDNCRIDKCEHRCKLDRDCWEKDCSNTQCAVDHENVKPWEFPTCFLSSCSHDCDDSCYEIECHHQHTDRHCYNLSRIEGFQHDGSVHVEGALCGEVASRPYADLPSLKAWIEKNGPDKVNKTCGTHIHVSVLKEADYDYLVDTEKQFYKYFIENVEAWGRTNLERSNIFWHRFNGENQYCCRNDRESCNHGDMWVHAAYKQARDTSKGTARYAHVNFCKNFHGTIEFRIFHGMKTPELIMSAVQTTIDIVDSYLVMSRRSQDKEVCLLYKATKDKELAVCA